MQRTILLLALLLIGCTHAVWVRVWESQDCSGTETFSRDLLPNVCTATPGNSSGLVTCTSGTATVRSCEGSTCSMPCEDTTGQSGTCNAMQHGSFFVGCGGETEPQQEEDSTQKWKDLLDKAESIGKSLLDWYDDHFALFLTGAIVVGSLLLLSICYPCVFTCCLNCCPGMCIKSCMCDNCCCACCRRKDGTSCCLAAGCWPCECCHRYPNEPECTQAGCPCFCCPCACLRPAKGDSGCGCCSYDYNHEWTPAPIRPSRSTPASADIQLTGGYQPVADNNEF